MTIRTAGQPFQGGPGAGTPGFAAGHVLNIIDGVAQAIGTDQESGWTTGASLIQQVPATGPLPSNARVLSYQVSGNMGFHSSAPEPCGGKLEKVVAALQFGQYPLSNNLNPSPLPKDSSLIATLWDPAIDSLPPDDSTSPVTLLPVSVVNNLSQPQLIIEQVITVGIWFTPSLLTMKLGGFAIRALTLYDATFQITYDDGS